MDSWDMCKYLPYIHQEVIRFDGAKGKLIDLCFNNGLLYIQFDFENTIRRYMDDPFYLGYVKFLNVDIQRNIDDMILSNQKKILEFLEIHKTKLSEEETCQIIKKNKRENTEEVLYSLNVDRFNIIIQIQSFIEYENNKAWQNKIDDTYQLELRITKPLMNKRNP